MEEAQPALKSQSDSDAMAEHQMAHVLEQWNLPGDRQLKWLQEPLSLKCSASAILRGLPIVVNETEPTHLPIPFFSRSQIKPTAPVTWSFCEAKLSKRVVSRCCLYFSLHIFSSSHSSQAPPQHNTVTDLIKVSSGLGATKFSCSHRPVEQNREARNKFPRM